MSEPQKDNRAQTTVWTTEHGVLFGEYEDSRPISTGGHRRLNPAEPIWVDPTLMCSCNVCLLNRFPANGKGNYRQSNLPPHGGGTGFQC